MGKRSRSIQGGIVSCSSRLILIPASPQIKASQEAVISIPKLEQFIERMQGRIAGLDFEGKRQVLDMLNITVWLDGENVEITGVLPVADDVIVHTQS